MDSLQSIELGSFNKDQKLSKPDQISSYIMSALSAQTVALGGGKPDYNAKALNCGIAIGLSAIANNNKNGSGHGVAIGCETSAVNYGVAIGEKATSDLGLSFGSDAYSTNSATALGRYARATGTGSVQLNGPENKSVTNTEANTLKFYAGSHGNVTIVDNSGKIPLATSATKLTSDGGSTTIPVYFNNGVPVAITSYSGKADTAGTAEQADKVKCYGSSDAYVQLSVCNVVPTSGAQNNILYLVVES